MTNTINPTILIRVLHHNSGRINYRQPHIYKGSAQTCPLTSSAFGYTFACFPCNKRYLSTMLPFIRKTYNTLPSPPTSNYGFGINNFLARYDRELRGKAPVGYIFKQQLQEVRIEPNVCIDTEDFWTCNFGYIWGYSPTHKQDIHLLF